MKNWVLLLGCLLVATSQAQTRRDVWQWRDENGVTHFSDYPQPGARRITLNGAPAARRRQPSSAAAATVRGRHRQPRCECYDRLEIWSPESGQLFRGGCRRQCPHPRGARAGAPHRLLTYLDGKLLPGENALEHSLTNVDRGVHSVTSVIVSRDGTELIRSEPVVFHMRQPTANNPRNQGPAMRPPQPCPCRPPAR